MTKKEAPIVKRRGTIPGVLKVLFIAQDNFIVTSPSPSYVRGERLDLMHQVYNLCFIQSFICTKSEGDEDYLKVETSNEDEFDYAVQFFNLLDGVVREGDKFHLRLIISKPYTLPDGDEIMLQYIREMRQAHDSDLTRIEERVL